ncbi:MAG TPA: hypothetical protein VKZ18_26075 [Polyangia bacterium]|nr:hypothetical protein [Polyangia bacterium]
MLWGLLISLLARVGTGTDPAAKAEVVHSLPEADWPKIDAVTGFHSVVHKPAKLELRVIEFDGSASVAWDPVSLFVVATNDGTSDLEENIWLLPRGVEAVKKVSATACGVEIQANVDKIGKGELIVGEVPVTLEACFIDPQGKLESDLRLSVGPSVSGRSSRRR